MTKDIGEQLHDHLAKVSAGTVTPEDRANIIEAARAGFVEWNAARQKEIKAREWEALGAEQTKLTAIITEWAKVKGVSMSEAFQVWGDSIAEDTRAHRRKAAPKQRRAARKPSEPATRLSRAQRLQNPLVLAAKKPPVGFYVARSLGVRYRPHASISSRLRSSASLRR